MIVLHILKCSLRPSYWGDYRWFQIHCFNSVLACCESTCISASLISVITWTQKLKERSPGLIRLPSRLWGPTWWEVEIWQGSSLRHSVWVSCLLWPWQQIFWLLHLKQGKGLKQSMIEKGKKLNKNKKGKQERKRKKRESTTEKKIKGWEQQKKINKEKRKKLFSLSISLSLSLSRERRAPLFFWMNAKEAHPAWTLKLAGQLNAN